MRLAIVGLAMLVTGCGDKGQAAEDRYALLAKSGTDAEKCEEAKRVEDAYLTANNEAKYKQWRQTRESDCSHAEIQARLQRY